MIDIDIYRARSEWYHLDNVFNPDSAEALAASVQVEAGKNYITQVDDRTGVPVPQCVQAVTLTQHRPNTETAEYPAVPVGREPSKTRAVQDESRRDANLQRNAAMPPPNRERHGRLIYESN